MTIVETVVTTLEYLIADRVARGLLFRVGEVRSD